MKQVIRRGIKEIIVDEVPDPVVTPHHVLVRPLYSLISSGTETADIHKEGVLKEVADNPSHLAKIWNVMKNVGPLATVREVRAKFSDYAVLGYSGAGIVVDRHPTAADLEIGQRVAYGGEGTGHGEAILTGRNLVARIPDDVTHRQACFATLGSIAMNAVRIARPGLGETVAVIGLGLVGQLVVQLARLQGAVTIGVDLREERVDLARALGADHAVSGGASLKEAVGALTGGRGADVVIIAAAAKSAAPCQQGLAICRDRGRLVVVGAVEMSFPWGEMYMKEIQLFMARAYGPGSYDTKYERQGQDYPLPYVRWTENRNMEEFLRLVALKRVMTDPLITHEFTLEDASQAYDTIMDPESGSLAVVLRYPEMESAQEFRPKRKVEITSAVAKKEGEIGFGLVGAGNLAKWAHMPILQKMSGARLVAVHSSSGARGKSYGIRFGASYATTEYETMLQDSGVDAVIVVSRNQHHASQTIAALEAGKHVFVEKPMALTEDECRAIAHAAQQAGKVLAVGFNRRFAPFYQGLKAELKRRQGPAVVQCRINSPGISGNYWMADMSIGGAILGEACHFVDLMFWLLDSEPVEVTAYSLPRELKDPAGENNMVASFRFADGSIGSLTYCTVGSASSGGERVEAFAQGIGAISEDFKRLVVKRVEAREQSKMFAEKGYKEQMEEFATAIREGRQPAVGLRDGVRATLGCLKMLEAARTGAACSIDTDSLLTEV